MSDQFTTQWIISNSIEIMKEYPEGMTVRQLHYRLVALGMTNDIQHYKKVCVAMKKARWDDTISMNSFVDRERTMYGETLSSVKDIDTEIETAQRQVKAWMNNYHLNPWSNQDEYIEVWIEKKALQGVFEPRCDANHVGLGACKGYPSLTFLNEAARRLDDNEEKKCTIVYFGDYDPSGEDIPRALGENLDRMGVDVTVERIALHPEQIKQLKLAGVPPKIKDTRTQAWDGTAAVELDAVEPNLLRQMCEDAILKHWSWDKHQELEAQEAAERKIYRQKLQDYVNTLGTDEEDDTNG